MISHNSHFVSRAIMTLGLSVVLSACHQEPSNTNKEAINQAAQVVKSSSVPAPNLVKQSSQDTVVAGRLPTFKGERPEINISPFDRSKVVCTPIANKTAWDIAEYMYKLENTVADQMKAQSAKMFVYKHDAKELAEKIKGKDVILKSDNMTAYANIPNEKGQHVDVIIAYTLPKEAHDNKCFKNAT